MALSGGKGNSRSQTATSNQTTTEQFTSNNVDNRVSEGDGAIFGGNTALNLVDAPVGVLNLNMTDLGAVAAGVGLARSSMDSLVGIAESSISASQGYVAQAYSLADKARQSETSGAIQNTLYIGGGLIALAIIAYAVSRAKK